MNEVKVINAEEFGLEKKSAQELTVGLDVVLAEREPLIKSYKDLIELEITEENIPLFKALRLKIVKNRTQGINKWHEKSKAFFLAGGRFVDAIKNKEMLVNTSMEEKLMSAEKHFENLEKERIEKLNQQRHNECIGFVEDESLILPNLGSMPDSIWDNYIIGLEASFNARIEAEKKAKEEAERLELIEKLNKERKDIALPYFDYWSEFEKTLNFGEVSESDFNNFMVRNETAKKKHEAEQEKIRKENERLKKDKEKADKLAADKQKQKNLRAKELQPYIVFIRDYNALIESNESDYKKQFSDIKKGAEEHWEFEIKEQIRKQ